MNDGYNHVPYVLDHIQGWPANRVRDLLPWKADLAPT